MGNFIYNWNSFYNASKKEKLINLASLALAVGLPIIKLIPKIKEKYLKNKLFSLGSKNINVSTLLNGLNILYAVGMEFYSIFSFSRVYTSSLTWKYSLKRGIRLFVGIGFSFLGNLLSKLSVNGILVIIGIPLGPLNTILLGILSSTVVGYLGTKVGDKLCDMVFRKDEFVMTSPHLYCKYIPNKYREKGHNPSLKWKNIYKKIKSFIIECIVDEVEIIMQLINIPNDVDEIDECLSLNNDNNSIIDDDNCSESTENSEKEEEIIKIHKKGKFIGDLVIPYKGIKCNCSSINFIIYGIKKEKMSAKDWAKFGKKKENIEFVFNLSVY